MVLPIVSTGGLGRETRQPIQLILERHGFKGLLMVGKIEISIKLALSDQITRLTNCGCLNLLPLWIRMRKYLLGQSGYERLEAELLEIGIRSSVW